MTTKHTTKLWEYEKATKTIRSIPSNHWIATMDSFDGAVNNEANARLIAAAPETAEERDRLKEINKELLEALEYVKEKVMKFAKERDPEQLGTWGSIFTCNVSNAIINAERK